MQAKNELSELTRRIIQFRDDRDWARFHDPKNLSQAIGIEAAELQEIFLWKTNAESTHLANDERDHVREEVADIFIYLITMCHGLNIDILQAVGDKIKRNGQKYPIEKCKGSNIKYTMLGQ